MRRQSETLVRARDLAVVASYAARLRSLLEDAEPVTEALRRLGTARVRGALYALDCIGESTDGRRPWLRSQESFVLVDEALREVIEGGPVTEPEVLAEEVA